MEKIELENQLKYSILSQGHILVFISSVFEPYEAKCLNISTITNSQETAFSCR